MNSFLPKPSQTRVPRACDRRLRHRGIRSGAWQGHPAARVPAAPGLQVAKQAEAATAAGPSPQQLEQLCSWAKSKGVSVDKLGVVPSLRAGRASSLVAARDIAAGEAVLVVPDSLWLTPKAAQASSIGGAVEGLEPWLQIALFIAQARTTGDTGQWGPYLATLSAQHTPLFWTKAQQLMLQGSQLVDSLEGYRAFFAATYQELFGPGGRLAAQAGSVPFETFVAAVAAVRAHTHAPLEAGALCLVPLADMVAHRRAGNTVWKTKAAGLFGRGQNLVLEATQPIQKGQELSTDFAPGKPDNAVLLDYGVFDDSNPQPGYTLSLSLEPGDRLMDDKLGVVESTPGLAQAMAFTLAPATPPSDTMLGFLRLSKLKGPDAFLLEPVFSQEVWGYMCDPVSQDNERDVCTTMAQGARAAQARYASTIDADLALLQDGSLAQGSIEEAVVKVRLGELECLDFVAEWFEERLAQLPRLAYYQERRLRRLGLIDDEGRTTYDSFFKDGIA